MELKVKYVLKSESDKYINELKFKMKKFETDNITFRQDIKHLQEENEKLIQEKEYLEQQIYSQLNNIRTSCDDNKKINLENLIEVKDDKENEAKEEDNSESLDKFQEGNDLGDLLGECEENETDKEPPGEENLPDKDNNIPAQKNNDIIENLDKVLSDYENNNIDKSPRKNDASKKVTFSTDIKLDLKNSLRKSKSKNVRLRAMNKFSGLSGPINLRYNKISSRNINSAYDVMFKGKQFQFPSSIVSNKNIDYFKEFFFLLFQAMKMNSDDIGSFLEYDPQTLYEQCRKEHIPFHKYQKWLEKQLIKNEQIKNEKQYEDFATITGIFCSSFL